MMRPERLVPTFARWLLAVGALVVLACVVVVTTQGRPWPRSWREAGQVLQGDVEKIGDGIAEQFGKDSVTAQAWEKKKQFLRSYVQPPTTESPKSTD